MHTFSNVEHIPQHFQRVRVRAARKCIVHYSYKVYKAYKVQHACSLIHNTPVFFGYDGSMQY